MTANSDPPVQALTLTAARARLFRLAEDLLSGQLNRVILTHKGFEESLVLVRESNLAALERQIDALREHAGVPVRALSGLGKADGSAEEILAHVRSRQRKVAASRRETLYGGQDAIAWRAAERAPPPHRPRGAKRAK